MRIAAFQAVGATEFHVNSLPVRTANRRLHAAVMGGNLVGLAHVVQHHRQACGQPGQNLRQRPGTGVQLDMPVQAGHGFPQRMGCGPATGVMGLPGQVEPDAPYPAGVQLQHLRF